MYIWHNFCHIFIKNASFIDGRKYDPLGSGVILVISKWPTFQAFEQKFEFGAINKRTIKLL